ncbi:MAG: hypothetical protein R2912_10150 [Eubacteriales bacterium]
MMLGLQRASAESAAPLGNFEIVATSIIALALFSGEDFEETLIADRLDHGLQRDTLDQAGANHLVLGGVAVDSRSLRLLGVGEQLHAKNSSKNTAQIVILKGVFSHWLAHCQCF